MKQLVYKNKSRWTTSTVLFSPDWITKLVNEGCNIFGLSKIFDSISGKKKNLTWKINLNWLGYELCHTPVLILTVNFAFSARGGLGAHKTSPTWRAEGGVNAEWGATKTGHGYSKGSAGEPRHQGWCHVWFYPVSLVILWKWNISCELAKLCIRVIWRVGVRAA